MLKGKTLVKRIVATGVAVAVAALMAPPAWVACLPAGITAGIETAQAEPKTSGDFEYIVEGVSGSEFVTIVGYKVDGKPVVKIPNKIEGKNVKFIAKQAFSEEYDKIHDSSDSVHHITSVEIPNTVESIMEGAFEYCESLAKVDIKGNGLGYIGDTAFLGCKKLTSIALPADLQQIGNLAFFKAGLTSITIPKECYAVSHEGNPFGYCPITKFTLASGNSYHKVVNSGTMLMDEEGGWVIGYANACSTKTPKLPKDGPNITPYAFAGAKKITSISIPKGTHVIGDSAFSHCDNLAKVTISKSAKLDTIEANAFDQCKKLKKIYIPKSVNTIGEDAFGWWTEGEGTEEPEGHVVSGFYMTGESSSYEGLKYAKVNKWLFLTTSKVTKLTSKKKSLKVKVKKAKGVSSSKKAYKYQIAYKKKGSSKWKKVKIKSTTKTIKKLKKGKKYQVKVRSLKKQNGKYCYGEWSSVKTSKKIK